MYVETKRSLSEREVNRLRKPIPGLRDDIRDVPKRFSCCLGFFLPIGVVVYFLNRGDPYLWFELTMGAVILSAIVAAAGLEATQESRKALRKLEGAIESGFAIESHVTASRCFMVEGDDEGSDYYIDVGEQGTVVINDLVVSSRRFPSSDFTAVRIFGADSKVIDVINRSKSDRLTPVDSYPRDSLRDSPQLERFVHVESFTLFPEPFDMLMQLIEHQAS